METNRRKIILRGSRNFSEYRYFDMDKLRAARIKYGWFTHASTAKYDAILSRVDIQKCGRLAEATTFMLEWFLGKIKEYSDADTYDQMEDTGILYVLANECCVVIFEDLREEE